MGPRAPELVSGSRTGELRGPLVLTCVPGLLARAWPQKPCGSFHPSGALSAPLPDRCSGSPLFPAARAGPVAEHVLNHEVGNE